MPTLPSATARPCVRPPAVPPSRPPWAVSRAPSFTPPGGVPGQGLEGHGAAVSVLDVPGTNHFTIVEELAHGGVLLERVLTMLE